MDFGIDPYLHDSSRWGVSMAQHAEVLLPALDTANVKSIVEVGAYAGDLTRLLVLWAAGAGATVAAVDPSPQPGLVALAEEHPALDLIRKTSLDALPTIDLPDAVIIDGDHNWFTVSEELRMIAERASGAALPLLLFHDVSWPHARRDDYYAPELIPDEHRQPLVGEGGGIRPGEPGVVADGVPYPRSAAREGGARNGVLTAIEDFVGAHDGLRLVVVPAFFGFGVVWHEDAPWSDALGALLERWDRDPVLERMEANRVHHLAESHARQVEIWRLRERLGKQEAVLRRLLESSAFGVAEQLSRLRVKSGVAPAQSVISRDEVRRALEE